MICLDKGFSTIYDPFLSGDQPINTSAYQNPSEEEKIKVSREGLLISVNRLRYKTGEPTQDHRHPCPYPSGRDDATAAKDSAVAGPAEEGTPRQE